ncbi:hypothetical protein [Thiomonas sp.]|uniref:hypothetical protein n=1 Tax=Thiomonas sp. TaxID=2047785 RepID=UPI002625EF18|nr:hypothetical protein [Thiomonas sp.]
MDVQNALGWPAVNAAQTVASPPAPQPQTTAAAAGAAAASPAPPPPAAAKAVSAAALAQAADTLQKQISQNAPSIALSAGLDPDGQHPGQLLVELKDKLTQQVFVRYYIPAEQVMKAAAQEAGQPMPPGSLLQEKA